MSLAPTLLDLCAGSGSWSQPFADAGWHVIRVDMNEGQDVRLLEYREGPVDGILAAPPCTVFASSGARWERSEAEMLEALSVADACLRQVVLHRPLFWALENPVGTLSRWLGPPRYYFQPNEYGDGWTKKTALWGDFCMPWKDAPVPADPKAGPHWMAPSPGRAAARAVTPEGFARAFYQANAAREK